MQGGDCAGEQADAAGARGILRERDDLRGRAHAARRYHARDSQGAGQRCCRELRRAGTNDGRGGE